MNRQKLILILTALLLMGGAAGVLARMKTNQRLGAPGVKTEPLPGGRNLQVVLPERVLNYTSTEIPLNDLVTNTLPADTSFGQRYYTDQRDTNQHVQLSVVLMGTDRTSIHKPQFCLQGWGWNIDAARSHETTITVPRPQPYELPVVKLVATRVEKMGGQEITLSGLYVYWFVADNALSGDMTGRERMWWMASHLMRTGELQRWAYASCFCVCLPGQEEATFERMKAFIAASVPEFQLTPQPAEVASVRP